MPPMEITEEPPATADPSYQLVTATPGERAPGSRIIESYREAVEVVRW